MIAVKNILDTIGQTPLVALKRVVPWHVRIYTKWEWCNPTFSMKDRIALYMIESAEKKGDLKPGMTIVAPSSGNTATSIAMVGAVKGYRVVITAPDKTSAEKIAYSKAFGAQVLLCPTSAQVKSPDHYICKAAALCQELPHAYLLDQYSSLCNQDAHALTTGPEIWQQTQGAITHLVAAAGSGGAICAMARYLKQKNPALTVVSPDAQGSVYGYFKQHGVCGGGEGETMLEGVGKKDIPMNMDINLIDTFIPVTDAQALSMCKKLATEEGVLVGGSSAASLCAALQLVPDMRPTDLMVVVFPDSGVKYLSKIYNEVGSF